MVINDFNQQGLPDPRLQGACKECFPGCVKLDEKVAFCLPTAGRRRNLSHPKFTKPGKHSLEVSCSFTTEQASEGAAPRPQTNRRSLLSFTLCFRVCSHHRPSLARSKSKSGLDDGRLGRRRVARPARSGPSHQLFRGGNGGGGDNGRRGGGDGGVSVEHN